VAVPGNIISVGLSPSPRHCEGRPIASAGVQAYIGVWRHNPQWGNPKATGWGSQKLVRFWQWKHNFPLNIYSLIIIFFVKIWCTIK